MLAITAHSFDAAERPVYVHRRATDAVSRLTRRNDAYDISRAICDSVDSFDGWLDSTRHALALGLLILRAQRRTPQGRSVCAGCGHLATHSRRGQSFCDRCAD